MKERTTKTFAVAITVVAAAVILIIAFAWFGPGLEGASSSASAALFDERLVQDIYTRVSPAVVEIRIDRRGQDSFTRVGSGSGFLIDEQGHIVTNNHVIQDADRVRVSFQNGKSVEAEILGTNPGNDLALLKVDSAAVAGIVPVALGDSSKAKPGQMAIAIGSPFGLDGSVTVGVISGVGRTLNSDLSRPIAGVLQTDALIGPGNSGGPLLNSSGEVVGINTAIQVARGGQDLRTISGSSIGFAVPINTLADLLPRLKEGLMITPPWLGISAISLEPLLVESLGLPADRGVYITQIMPGSPAEQAGLSASGSDFLLRPTGEGDIIIAVDGVPVDGMASLIILLNEHLPGDGITLKVIRDGQETDVPVTLGEWPEDQLSTRPRILPEPDTGIPFIPGLPFPDLFPENPHR